MFNVSKQLEKELAEIPELLTRMSMLSTEDNSVWLTNISDFARKPLITIRNIFNSNSESNTWNVKKNELTVQARKIIELNNKITNIVNNVEYSNIRSIDIPVLNGLKTNLYEASSLLLDGSKDVSKQTIKYLDTADTIVDKALADKDYMRSLSPVSKNYFFVVDANTKLENIINKIVDANSHKDKLKIGEVITNINSLKLIHTNLIEINNILNYKLINSIRSILKDITLKANMLIEKYDNNEDKINKDKLLTMADYLEQTAKHITVVSNLVYLTNMTNDVFKALVEKLDK